MMLDIHPTCYPNDINIIDAWGVSLLSLSSRVLPPLYLPEPRGELTRVWGQALALVGGHVVGLEVGVDGVILEGAHHLLDGVGDEDEGDEAGEALLGEARHVLDDVAGVRGHQDEALQAGVHPDPQTQLHVIYPVVPAGQRERGERHECIGEADAWNGDTDEVRRFQKFDPRRLKWE